MKLEVFVMDESFRSLYNLDTFESLIWTERYNGCGNFEFYTPVNQAILQVVNVIQNKMEKLLDCYVWLKESGNVMVIEDMEITTDVETGNHLIVSGRGLESLLERRIIWDQTILNGNLQNGIKKLIDQAIINPTIVDRKIPKFLFSVSTNEYIEKQTIRAQYTGDNLYDTILAICKEKQLGFDVTLDLNDNFAFSLSYGENRSYDQEKNPYVIFSPKYENIINSDYLESSKTLKNVTLVAGENEDTYETQNESGGTTVYIDPDSSIRRKRIVGSGSSLARRELYTDARDIQSDVEGGKLTDEEYYALLDQRGAEKLAENQYTKVFTGEIEATKTFVYGKDFFKGDIVQIVNEYGMESKVRVSEVVRVQDTNGYKVYPTFEVVA